MFKRQTIIYQQILQRYATVPQTCISSCYIAEYTDPAHWLVDKTWYSFHFCSPRMLGSLSLSPRNLAIHQNKVTSTVHWKPFLLNSHLPRRKSRTSQEAWDVLDLWSSNQPKSEHKLLHGPSATSFQSADVCRHTTMRDLYAELQGELVSSSICDTIVPGQAHLILHEEYQKEALC